MLTKTLYNRIGVWRVKLPKAVAGARQNVDSAHTKTATDTILCNPALRDCRSIVNRQQGFSYLLFRTIRVSAIRHNQGFGMQHEQSLHPMISILQFNINSTHLRTDVDAAPARKHAAEELTALYVCTNNAGLPRVMEANSQSAWCSKNCNKGRHAALEA